MAQWWRICQPVQKTRVKSLMQKVRPCRRATKPMCQNYWDYVLEPGRCNYGAHTATGRDRMKGQNRWLNSQFHCCCQVASVVSDSVRPHRRQPTRLPRPWDSPGKNTGVGCLFLLQCVKVESESEVAQSCPTLNDPMDCSLPGSSAHGIFQARVLEWVAIAFSGQFH